LFEEVSNRRTRPIFRSKTLSVLKLGHGELRSEDTYHLSCPPCSFEVGEKEVPLIDRVSPTLTCIIGSARTANYAVFAEEDVDFLQLASLEDSLSWCSS
jgi:hypothetical protein